MHSFNSCLMHCVFAVKERRPLLTADIRERLWPYLGGNFNSATWQAVVTFIPGFTTLQAFSTMDSQFTLVPVAGWRTKALA